MALTPEDVHNKTFGNSRLGRKGYDETEVDDFLDEVFDEMTRLTREHEELTTKLSAAQRALAVAQEQLRRGGASQPAPAEAPAPAPAPTPAAATAPPAEAATGILALAQRTADEHVASARKEAEGVLGEARRRAESLTREAEERQRQTLGALDGERVALERRLEELRVFEREYRSRLKSYLEGQLRDLDVRGPGNGRPDGAHAGGSSNSFAAAPSSPPQGGGFILDEGPEGQ